MFCIFCFLIMWTYHETFLLLIDLRAKVMLYKTRQEKPKTSTDAIEYGYKYDHIECDVHRFALTIENVVSGFTTTRPLLNIMDLEYVYNNKCKKLQNGVCESRLIRTWWIRLLSAETCYSTFKKEINKIQRNKHGLLCNLITVM